MHNPVLLMELRQSQVSSKYNLLFCHDRFNSGKTHVSQKKLFVVVKIKVVEIIKAFITPKIY